MSVVYTVHKSTMYMKTKTVFWSILFLLFFSFPIKSYAEDGIFAVSPFDYTVVLGNPNDPDYWLPVYEETNASLFDAVLNNLNVPEVGKTIRPFEGGAVYNYNLRLLSGMENNPFPDGDPTNCIPIGSALCLIIGIVCLCLARVVKTVLEDLDQQDQRKS